MLWNWTLQRKVLRYIQIYFAFNRRKRENESIDYKQNVWIVQIRDEEPKQKNQNDMKKERKMKNKTKPNRCKDVLHEREMIILFLRFWFCIDSIHINNSTNNNHKLVKLLYVCKSSPIRNYVVLWTQITI